MVKWCIREGRVVSYVRYGIGCPYFCFIGKYEVCFWVPIPLLYFAVAFRLQALKRERYTFRCTGHTSAVIHLLLTFFIQYYI